MRAGKSLHFTYDLQAHALFFLRIDTTCSRCFVVERSGLLALRHRRIRICFRQVKVALGSMVQGPSPPQNCNAPDLWETSSSLLHLHASADHSQGISTIQEIWHWSLPRQQHVIAVLTDVLSQLWRSATIETIEHIRCVTCAQLGTRQWQSSSAEESVTRKRKVSNAGQPESHPTNSRL